MSLTKWKMAHVLTNLPELQKRANELRDELKATVSDDNQALWLYIAHLEARDKYLKWWLKAKLDDNLQNLSSTEEQLRANDRKLNQRVRDCEQNIYKLAERDSGCLFVLVSFMATVGLGLAAIAFLSTGLRSYIDQRLKANDTPAVTVEVAAPEIDTTEPSAEPTAEKPEEQPYKVEVLDQNTEV